MSGSSRPLPPVLVVDDESLVRRCITRELRVTCAPLLEAASEGEAIERIETATDLLAVVTDLDPGRVSSGLTVLREARRRHPAAVRLLVSGRIEPEEAERHVTEGLVAAFLQKPWAPPALRSLLARSRAAGADRARRVAERMAGILGQAGIVQELAASARNGDDAAVFELLRRHRGLMSAIAHGRHQLRSGEADEAFRAVARSLARHLPRIGSVRAFLASATHAACLEVRRNSPRGPSSDPARRWHPRPASAEETLGRSSELLGLLKRIGQDGAELLGTVLPWESREDAALPSGRARRAPSVIACIDRLRLLERWAE